jgi:tetratricopeptide (TPR) repeat protein
VSSRRTGFLACPLSLALCFGAVSCSQRSQSSTPERLAILRFENLGADTTTDWMGRAFSQVIIRDLAGAAGVYAIPFDQLHSHDVAFGVRPIQTPGISAERTLALAAGANRLGYGEYAVNAGKVEARLTIEDPQTQKAVRVLLASGPASNPFEPADALARQIASGAAPYTTRSEAALEAYIKGLESANAQDRVLHLEEAISADPDFGPPQFLLAQWKAQHQDAPGALAVLSEALARKLPALENARLSYLAATLRGDSDAAHDALARWSHAAPNDEEVWSSVAADSMARHQYKQAVQANQKALAVQPDDANILNQLGYSAALSGQLDMAMSALQRYQSLHPGDPNPLDSMGDVNLVLGRLREAENFYLQAVKSDPSFLNGGDYFKAAMARLMSGDVAGADPLAKQFADHRAAAKDPMADFYRAQWSWISGRRKTGFRQMQTLAADAEKSAGGQNAAVRSVASQAYSQLAIWSLALGDRSRGAQWAVKAAALTIPATANFAALARFLAQPSASESEWTLRAERAFPNPTQTRERDTVLAYALLADKEFAAAAKVLEPLYKHSSLSSEEALPVLLAWAYIESGKPQQAEGLLRFNPIPSEDGVKPLSLFEFPRLFYLRGRLAALAGNPEQAQSYYKLFAKLSGDEPLIWGEEAAAEK